MSDYRNILVAIDVYAKEDIVLQQARKIAHNPTDISLITVTVP